MKRGRDAEEELPDELDPVALLLALSGAPRHHDRKPRATEVNYAAAAARHARSEVEADDDDAVTAARGDPAVPCKAFHSSGVNLLPSRRTYVWRGPHREELTLHKKQQQQQQQQDAADATNNSSSHRSSASYALPSDDDEVAQQQQQQQHYQHYQQLQHQYQQVPPSSRDSTSSRATAHAWAALTTWLRMNLHKPRTNKRVVLFLGEQNAATGCWGFRLNPQVSWREVSLETKLRLKTLLVEAEQSHQAKYPSAGRDEWRTKVQRYNPPGSAVTSHVTLWDVVNGLHTIYLEHEEGGSGGGILFAQPHGASSSPPPPHHQEHQQQQQHYLTMPPVPAAMQPLQQHQPEALPPQPQQQWRLVSGGMQQLQPGRFVM